MSVLLKSSPFFFDPAHQKEQAFAFVFIRMALCGNDGHNHPEHTNIKILTALHLGLLLIECLMVSFVLQFI